MIDIKLIRENPEKVTQNTRDRGYDVEIVTETISLDKKWREYKLEDDKLRFERNKISEEINKAKKAKKESEAKKLINKAKEIVDKINIQNDNRRKN